MTTVSSNTVNQTLYYKPSQPIERPFPIYPELHEKEKRAKALASAETLLSEQPKIVQITVNKRYDTLLKEQGLERANAYLAKNFIERIYPRVELVTKRYCLTNKNSETYRFFNWFNAMPDMSRKSLESLALELSAFVFTTLSDISKKRTDEGDLKIAYMLYTEAAAITQAYHQEPPRLDKLSKRYFNEKDAFIAIAQMTSEKWWLARLRRHAAEWREHLHIALTNVSKRTSIYASSMTMSEWKEQKRRTREFLKSMELEDEEGNRFSLIDKYYGSVANPAIRRTEMMVRIRGFENICNELGYIAEFYTLTAPSKYHATTIHGHRNRKWNGSSPADTQRYLSKVWSKMRAKLHRKDLRIFGIRVAEPHHDATPHWHMLFFMLPEQADSIREILREYSIATSANYVASIEKDMTIDVGQSATVEIGQKLIEKVGLIKQSIAGTQQQIIAPVVWIGSQQINVAQLMIDTLDVVKELAELTAAHTHSNTGAPLNAQDIKGTGTKSDTLNEKYSPVIGK